MSSRRGGRRGSISSQISARSSIPIRAFTSPHPPSIAGSHKTEYRLRDPYLVVHGGRNSRGRDLDTMSRYSRANRKWWRTLPPHGWCFFIGFIFPPVWWVASFTDPRHIVVSRMKDNGLIEEWNESDKGECFFMSECLSKICRRGINLALPVPFVEHFDVDSVYSRCRLSYRIWALKTRYDLFTIRYPFQSFHIHSFP
ncbi:uncharacterized protein EI90DRAFT_3052427 [Cantharellus anzutake]|uniref:uncharacterized protein n=1 Tax=Cantharellus anzutake TaxID=1750568 RepID=UPI001906AF4A|nr:uncharacterized protein EI90DRAFT_3052427 [Cantharellus anzutake]KAF8333574.1 hypothetical protein EI90DRAFT_3052427 [Cantharellus anzutake]